MQFNKFIEVNKFMDLFPEKPAVAFDTYLLKTIDREYKSKNRLLLKDIFGMDKDFRLLLNNILPNLFSSDLSDNAMEVIRVFVNTLTYDLERQVAICSPILENMCTGNSWVRAVQTNSIVINRIPLKLSRVLNKELKAQDLYRRVSDNSNAALQLFGRPELLRADISGKRLKQAMISWLFDQKNKEKYSLVLTANPMDIINMSNFSTFRTCQSFNGEYGKAPFVLAQSDNVLMLILCYEKDNSIQKIGRQLIFPVQQREHDAIIFSRIYGSLQYQEDVFRHWMQVKFDEHYKREQTIWRVQRNPSNYNAQEYDAFYLDRPKNITYLKKDCRSASNVWETKDFLENCRLLTDTTCVYCHDGCILHQDHQLCTFLCDECATDNDNEMNEEANAV